MPAKDRLLTLTPLSAADPLQIEALLDAAFGADRRGRTAYRLREGVDWLRHLSFAAWDGGTLVGTLQSWPIALSGSGGEHRLVMVGPVAVIPDRQGTGIGRALMDRLIQAAEAAGETALMMIGDPDYYGRWGFAAEQTGGWRINGPYEQHRLLARLTRPIPKLGTLQSLRHSRESGNPAEFAPA
jgi:predicted N-acetyltransferase YhbS